MCVCVCVCVYVCVQIKLSLCNSTRCISCVCACVYTCTYQILFACTHASEYNVHRVLHYAYNYVKLSSIRVYKCMYSYVCEPSRVSYRGKGAPGFPPPPIMICEISMVLIFEDVQNLIKVYLFWIRSFNRNAHY